MRENRTLTYLIIAAIIFLILIYASKRCMKMDNEQFSVEDQQAGKEALDELEKLLSFDGYSIPNISDEELEGYINDIYIVKFPSEDTDEKLEYFHAENTRYWPHYYYSFPYNYKYGGAWPPGMYSRLYYWSPGFYTGSGWSHYMRPGIFHKNWPRNRWIRNTQNGKDAYYYVTNRDDYTHRSQLYRHSS